ncbi:hypothetical protein B296_00047626 [Ensete ventricosum]|uniref:Reticulon domain-containing protein n=1 Tax=Ensete ventricosum TaxID=4639 RepID=A0A426YYK1_ENSVE|nr:hypothetical protein B296_00047626 [Ensete ventricosum]
MAEHSEESVLTEEIQQKPRGHDSSSSLSSGPDAEKPGPSPSVKVTPYRLFSLERPVHQVLGSGRSNDRRNSLFPFLIPADVMLWRNKKISAGVLTGGTAIWALSPPRIPEGKIDASAEKAMTGIKQQYAVFDAKVLSMIRRRPPKAKKH